MKNYILALGSLIILCCIFAALALNIVQWIDYHNSDFFTFWLAGRMVWTNENPYATQQWVNAHHQYGARWIPNRIFPYPIALMLIFAPLGRLPLMNAFIVWAFTSQVMIVLSIIILLSTSQAPRINKYLIPLLAASLLFRPSIVTFINGQLSAWLLLVATVAIVLWHNGRRFLGGVFFGLLMLKPSIGAPAILFISLWLVGQKNWIAILGMCLTLVLSLLTGYVFDDRWVQNFILIGSHKLTLNFGNSPTAWGIGKMICRAQMPCSLALGALLAAIIIIGLSYYLWKYRQKLAPLSAASVILPCVVLITPYIWSYDQLLLLIPITAALIYLVAKDVPFLITATLPLILSALSLVLIFVSLHVGRDYWTALIPIAALAMFLLAARQKAVA